METNKMQNLKSVDDSSLNRTMQYGNQELTSKNFGKNSRFKSYYVVWKLGEKEVYLLRDVVGLNRTMQYGNTLFLCVHLCPLLV